MPLPDWKKRAINHLGYGDSSKIFLGVNQRTWRDDGFNGGAYSDVGFQNSWDSNQLEPGPASSLTLFLGGQTALQSGNGSADQQAASFLPGVEAVFPGTTAALNGRTARAYWPGNPYVKAGYACFLPGQWTTIAGTEILPVGNILFAGEHCSYDFQGYMNGGAQTGRIAAETVKQRVHA